MADEIQLSLGKERKSYVKKMFNNIAPRYDFLNHFLSLGMDILWRKKAINMLEPKGSNSFILDLACGTGDFAAEAAGKTGSRLMGLDIALEMLKHGSAKKKNNSLLFLNSDAENLPFKDNVYDAVTIAFGIRNMGNISRALGEMFRVLKAGSEAIILEFSTPSLKPFRTLYLFYFNRILPWIGNKISGDSEAYSYLPASVDAFPQIDDFIKEMQNIGYENVSTKKLLFGVAVIYKGFKK